MGRVSRTILNAALAALIGLVPVSCGGSGDNDDPDMLLSIKLTPENPSIGISGTLRFTATGTFDSGATRNLTNELSWTTADGTIARAGIQGLVTGMSAGTTTVIATSTETGVSGSTGISSGCTAAVTNNGPVASRSPAQVTMGLSCANEALSSMCMTDSARICISGPEGFEADAGPFALTNASLAACGDSFVTGTNCVLDDGAPDVLEFHEATSAFAAAGGIDAAGYTGLQVHMRAAFSPFTELNDDINVFACCGPGCTAAFVGSALNLESGGTDSWAERGPFSLDNTIDNCASVAVVFSYQTVSVSEAAHMDDYALSGVGMHPFGLTDNLDGTYTGGFAACAPSAVTVSCTWTTANGTFQADNPTLVTFN